MKRKENTHKQKIRSKGKRVGGERLWNIKKENTNKQKIRGKEWEGRNCGM